MVTLRWQWPQLVYVTNRGALTVSPSLWKDRPHGEGHLFWFLVCDVPAPATTTAFCALGQRSSLFFSAFVTQISPGGTGEGGDPGIQSFCLLSGHFLIGRPLTLPPFPLVALTGVCRSSESSYPVKSTLSHYFS